MLPDGFDLLGLRLSMKVSKDSHLVLDIKSQKAEMQILNHKKGEKADIFHSFFDRVQRDFVES